MGFRNENELKRFLLAKCEIALIKAQEDIYRIIDRFLRDFYDEYDPVVYERTMQLFNSLVLTDIVRKGNGYEAYVYFDIDSLNYDSAFLTDEQIFELAAHGSHGGYVSGTAVWDEPNAIIKEWTIPILIGRLQAEGVPIKKK